MSNQNQKQKYKQKVNALLAAAKTALARQGQLDTGDLLLLSQAISSFEEKEEWPTILVCTFCGSLTDYMMPVEMPFPFRGTNGCERCMIKGKKGERVKLCSRYLARYGLKAFSDRESPATRIVERSKQWQHGTYVYLQGSEQRGKEYDLMDFVPEAYQPSEFQVLREKLLAMEAEFTGTIGMIDRPCAIPALSQRSMYSLWKLDREPIILAYNGEHAWLYDYVGELDAPVEQRLSYLALRREESRSHD